MMNEKRILVAFDFSAPSRRALAISRRYAEALGAAVDVVSVNDEPAAKSMLRSQGRALTQMAEEEAAAALEGIEYKVICPHGEPIRALIDMKFDQGLERRFCEITAAEEDDLQSSRGQERAERSTYRRTDGPANTR